MGKSDEELIVEYSQGDAEAFEVLFQRYKRPILNFALRILANRADAEDITGDVFLTLFSKRYTHKPHVRFSTWLFTVARNACISRIRKRKKMISLWFIRNENGEYEQWDIPDTGELPYQQAAKRETAIQVRKAIHRLPLSQKEALILREYHDLSYAQISEVLGCSMEKVKVLIFRARERLRTELPSFIMEDNHG